ncbi:50S ribosomal protein L25 [bacterium]|nr:MAG: 50S ribosomal protein L25 [bacterium]
MDFLLNVQKREAIGRQVKALRRSGLFPMVVYGYKIDALPIQTSQKEFTKILKDAGETSVISVKIEGNDTPIDVVIHDIAFDHSHNPIHADLYKIQEDKEIVTEIPLEFVGESKAVKELKCILVKHIESVEVKCLPKHLPHSLTVNLDVLENSGDVVRVSSIETEKGVCITNDSNDVVVIAKEPKLMKEEVKDVVVEEKKEEDGKAPATENNEEKTKENKK